MDLSPYGIRVSLHSQTNLDAIDASVLQRARSLEDEEGALQAFRFEDGIYRIQRFLGSGTYGSLYEVTDHDNRHYALKIVPGDLRSILQECLIHILLAETSKLEEDGPYVPRFYRLAYNSELMESYIVIELLDGTLQNVILSNTEAENDRCIPDAIRQVGKILRFYSKHLEFNHRDLKPDNVMYRRASDGTRIYTLIDFGLSCLTWNGLHIRANGPFRTCSRTDRDMPQFLYGLYASYRHFLSKRLQDTIYAMLKINIGSQSCMLQGCEQAGLRNWRSSYEFFNRPNVYAPSATLYTANTHMKHFAEGKPFQATQTFQNTVNAFANNLHGKEWVPTTKQLPKRLVRNTRKLNRRLISQ